MNQSADNVAMRARLQGAAAPGRRTLKRSAPFALTVVTLLSLQPISLRADDAKRPDLLYRRVFIVGDREAIKSDPDGPKAVKGYRYDMPITAAKELVVSDRREVPPPCGGKIARHFLDRLLARFHVQAVNTCTMGPSAVHCPSEYLTSYGTRKIFLELDYARSAQKVKLELNIFQREPGGNVAESTLNEADRNWYNELFSDLQEQVNCQ